MAMKIILPNGEKRNLDTNLDIPQRIAVANEIIAEWEDHFRANWEMEKTKVCLEVLSNYICMVKEPEQKYKEDKFVMSVTKMKKLRRGDRRSVPFTSLTLEEKSLLGIHSDDEMVGDV